MAVLRENALGKELRGRGAESQGGGTDGHQPVARDGTLFRRWCRRCRPGRAAGVAQCFRSLPDGCAARHPGLYRTGHWGRRARRRCAARRPAARFRRAIHGALRVDSFRLCAGRALAPADAVPARSTDRTAESPRMKSALRWLAAFALLAGLPFLMGGYYNDVYRKMLLWVALALSYNFLFGICGQVAFSHFAFYGVGAYSIVIFLFQFHLPFPLAALAGIAVCILVALAVAIPSPRPEGFYLALATLALGQLFIVVLNEGGAVTGGNGGIANYRLPDIFGVRVRGPWYTAVIVVLLVFTYSILKRLDMSWFGRACRAVRDNPEAAAAMGVDVARTKVIAFTLTSALAGLPGMVYAFVDNTA